MNILHFPKPTSTAPHPFWMPFPSLRIRPRRTRTATPAGPFAALAGKRVLLLVDDDNLRLGCERELRSVLSYSLLAAELERVTRSCDKHAFFSSSAGDSARLRYFQRRGFQTLELKREHQATPKGRVTSNSNADFDLVVHGAYLLALCCYDCVLVGSGDGDLVLALARGIERLQPGLQLFTLSVPGCTSHRILTRKTPLVAANFLVADSLLRPLHPRTRCSRPQRVRHAS